MDRSLIILRGVEAIKSLIIPYTLGIIILLGELNRKVQEKVPWGKERIHDRDMLSKAIQFVK